MHINIPDAEVVANDGIEKNRGSNNYKYGGSKLSPLTTFHKPLFFFKEPIKKS